MTTKLAVSLPDERVAAAHRAVAEGRATSVSGYVAEAMALRERTEALQVLLDDLDRDLGPPEKDAQAWADRELGLS